MPILSGCCFCFDLKVGTKFIGVLKLISALMNSIMFAGLLVMLVIMQVGASTAREMHKTSTSPSVDDDYENLNLEMDESAFELMQQHIGMVKLALYVLLGLAVLLIITSSMLIHGVRRNRRGLLIPYMIQESVALLVYIALAIAPLIAIGTYNPIVYFTLSVTGGILIHVYFLLVVFSQYQALGLIRMHEEISMK